MQPKNDNTGLLENAIKNISEFSLIFVKKTNLALYVICKEEDLSVFTTIEGITADRVDDGLASEILDSEATQLHMTNDCMFPMTVDAETCKIMQSASELDDFVFGISCRSKRPQYITSKISIMDNKKDKNSQYMIFSDEIKKKAKNSRFYLSNIFLSSSKNNVQPLLSSINFTYPQRQPNGLSVGKKDTINNLIKTPKFALFRKSFLRKRHVTVLSPDELFSLLTLPQHSAGLEMESGRNKTGANVIPHVDADPLDEFTQ